MFTKNNPISISTGRPDESRRHENRLSCAHEQVAKLYVYNIHALTSYVQDTTDRLLLANTPHPTLLFINNQP